LDGSLKQWTDEAEERKKAASSKNAYENISKSIKMILDKL
jgi:hypothetical protein